MGFFGKKVKFTKTEAEIAKEREDYIDDQKDIANIIKERVSPYIRTYCMDSNDDIYVFESVEYNEKDDDIHYNLTYSTTKPGYHNFWRRKKMSTENLLVILRKDRERFIKLRNQYKHFGLELIKTSDKKSSSRNNIIDDILEDEL